MNWLTKILGAILGGDDFSIGTGTDADATAAKVNGAIAFKAVTAGGPFGVGYGSLCYRSTGETNMDPSLVQRCNSYTWEGSDLTWYMNLNADGLLVGGRVTDTFAYPQARLDVRAHGGQNAARIVNVDGSTYLRLQPGTTSSDACVIFDDPSGNPVACYGRCGNLLGRPMNEINYGKFSGGVWVYGGTLYSW